jgi:hypothetical protein
VNTRYSVGYARPALRRETVLMAQSYLCHREWSTVKKVIKENNSFQARTARSGEIIFSEIFKRLSLLVSDQIEVIANDSNQDVCQLIWIALCKQYKFIGDFSIEVLVPAHLSGKYQIDNFDYDRFFNSKADWHPELDIVSEKTRSNARQALFQMMRQCELLSESDQLIPQMISAAVLNCTPNNELDYIPGATRL